MKTLIIITMHGKASENLLLTTEMLIGKQKDVIFINFLPKDDINDLFNKYNQEINNLNNNDNIIFLVDIWGGSPFNTASRIAKQRKNIEIISGVNIPMLIELFMSREDNLTFKELVLKTYNNGINGIKLFKYLNNIKKKKEEKKIKTNIQYNNKHMNIKLTRIDDRLIHGQIVTRWVKEIYVNRIIVINDEINNDNIRKTLLTQISPPGITSHVISINKFIRVWNNPKYFNDNVMLLFTNPNDILKVIKKGIKIKTINIGGMSYKKGKKQITNAISINEIDIKAFKELNNLCIELEIRKVPSDRKVNIMDLINNVRYTFE
ncbi:MAG: PTS mannose transporter subunit IIAB [Enterobacteriaceae bacterium PC38]|nr:MAG: PTS mannose transporter subunit IIAB [Enterobacteriaceae bacterium PC38]